jgi:hypothetical protein
MPTKVNLIGPVEPTGLSWLINCLIELNFKCSSNSETWEELGGKARLRRDQESLRRWLPALSDSSRVFNFRNDIEIVWSHDWLKSENLEKKTILFSRNPKTALFSGYKRLGPTTLSFHDYLIEIDPQWLLNRMQIWNLFHGLWSNHPNVQIFLFEEYKRDAIESLKSVIDFLGVDDIQQTELVHAVEVSSFEMAKRSEEKYLKQINQDMTPMIRQGSLSLEDGESERIAYELIDSNCSFLFETIKAGMPSSEFLSRSELNSQMCSYLEREPKLQPYFPNFELVGGSMSGYRHITRMSVEISKQTSNYNHVISAIQRAIFQNAIHDLKLLLSVRKNRNSTSNHSLFISLACIPLRLMWSRTKRFISSIRRD